MAGLTAVRAVISATVEIPNSMFERHSPFSPRNVGEQLAQQMDAYVSAESLGYYPALDYCVEREAMEAALVEVLEQLVWLGTSLVRDEVRQRLRPFFASVQVQTMQSTVYSLPQVRPGHKDAREQLARHLTPNRARFDLLLTIFRKHAGDEHIDTYVERVVQQHLSDPFERIETGGIKILQRDG